MSKNYKTLLEYFNSALYESRADDEYNKSFSAIDREIFDKICLMDPKTQRAGDEVINIGFGAKQLLLVKYLAGEVDLVDKASEITAALNNYYPNIKNYPKFPEFESVAAFLQFMENPVEIMDAPNKSADKGNKILDIYNKYYSDIDKDIFDQIIALDPQTTENKIGDIAKNLLLRCYKKGEVNFLKNPESVTAAIERYIEFKNTYEQDKQNLNSYASVADFISYIPQAPAITALAGDRYEPIAGQDYEHIASSKDYDIFKLITFRGSERLAHARGGENVWCTAGGSTGTNYGASQDHSRSTSYWRDYKSRGDLYMFLHKTEPTDRTKNWNMSYDNRAHKVYHFLDGNNHGPYGASDELAGIHRNWETFLLANPDVISALAGCSDENLKNDIVVRKLALSVSYSKKPYVVSDNDSLLEYIKNKVAYSAVVKELIIKNIDEIPSGFAANSITLEKVAIGPGVKRIGVQAFKNCPNLASINQDLPDTLEVIEAEAFMSCRSLKGSIHVPESLTSIKLRAFDGTRCRLKIDVNRKTPIKFNSADRDWVNAHVMSIKK